MPRAEKIKLFKLATNIITMFSVGKVAHDIIENNTNVETRTDEAKVWIGSFILGGLVVNQSCLATEHMIDAVVDKYDQVQAAAAEEKLKYKSDR